MGQFQKVAQIYRKASLKLADYYGKIRLIMLHKPEIAGQSACFASQAGNTSAIRAIGLSIGTPSLEPLSTPDISAYKCDRFLPLETIR